MARKRRGARQAALERPAAKRRGGLQQKKPKQHLTDAIVKRLAVPENRCPRTADDDRRVPAIHVRPFFGPHAKVADVTFADVDKLHQKITKTGATYAANRTISILSKMFSLAVRWKYRETNPCKGIERNIEY